MLKSSKTDINKSIDSQITSLKKKLYDCESSKKWCDDIIDQINDRVEYGKRVGHKQSATAFGEPVKNFKTRSINLAAKISSIKKEIANLEAKKKN